MAKTRKNRVFSDSEYNSNDGMLTSVWGPSMWHYLHTMSFNYPVNPTTDDKHRYRDFILSLRWTLPCGKCRKNLQMNFMWSDYYITNGNVVMFNQCQQDINNIRLAIKSIKEKQQLRNNNNKNKQFNNKNKNN